MAYLSYRTCGINERLSKMVGNSASYRRVDELKYLYNTGELHGSSSKRLDIIHWIIELHISKYLSMQNPSQTPVYKRKPAICGKLK